MTVSVGVLALQGNVSEHMHCVHKAGGRGVEVRTASDLQDVDSLIIPGGESTTMTILLKKHGLLSPLKKLIKSGIPVLATCAGTILLSNRVMVDEKAKAIPGVLKALDITVIRNDYGRQVDSFEETITCKGIGKVSGSFIRAPRISKVGKDVEVLATLDNDPVLVRSGNILAATFHPEIVEDCSLHRLLIGMSSSR